MGKNALQRITKEQSYVEDVETPTIMAYLFDHPLYLVALIAGVLLFCLRRIMH